MRRLSSLLLLLPVIGCSDISRGAALNECRMKYDLNSVSDQGRLIPECMQVKSYRFAAACGPSTDEHEWDWQVKSFAYDNGDCYRPIGPQPWIATALSPL